MEFCPATSQEKPRSFAKREVDYNFRLDLSASLRFGRNDIKLVRYKPYLVTSTNAERSQPYDYLN